MATKHSALGFGFLAAIAGVLFGTTGGCQLISQVDRELIPIGGGPQAGGSGGAGATGGAGAPGGAGATGGAATGGGGGLACDPTECPAGADACEVAACDSDEQCTLVDAPEGTSCTDTGNPSAKLCDSAGQCVECLAPEDCAGADETCEQNECVPLTCVNEVLDPDETDVDCGGPCPGCDNGMSCELADDCLSGFCDEGTCAPCVLDDDCGAGNFCDVDVCAAKLADGVACEGPNECLSGFCPADDGVCCESACDGECVACLDAKNGNAGDGVCDAVPQDADPDQECLADATACRVGGCNGDSVTPGCSPASDSTVCRTGSGDGCDPDETCSGGSCPSDVVTQVGTECRAGSGDACDPAETCTGVAGEACPTDVFDDGTTECRAVNGTCDVAESCSGTAGQACPTDGFAPYGTEVTACGKYVCSGTSAACITECTTDDDCSGTNLCNTANGNCN